MIKIKQSPIACRNCWTKVPATASWNSEHLFSLCLIHLAILHKWQKCKRERERMRKCSLFFFFCFFFSAHYWALGHMMLVFPKRKEKGTPLFNVLYVLMEIGWPFFRSRPGPFIKSRKKGKLATTLRPRERENTHIVI